VVISIDKLKNIIGPMLQGIPGVISVLLINQDGKLIYKNGRFDTSPEELAAGMAVNLAVITIVGKSLSQEMNTVLAEFNKMKIYQIQLTGKYFLVLFLKIKDVYFGEVRFKINKVVEEINNKILAK